jgi:hypothetical protein
VLAQVRGQDLQVVAGTAGQDLDDDAVWLHAEERQRLGRVAETIALGVPRPAVRRGKQGSEGFGGAARCRLPRASDEARNAGDGEGMESAARLFDHDGASGIEGGFDAGPGHSTMT